MSLADKHQQFKDEWLKSLRSGEYKQIKGQLGDDNKGRCCLGVACDVAIKQGLKIISVFDGEYMCYSCDSNMDDYTHDFIPIKMIRELDLPFDDDGTFDESEITFVSGGYPGQYSTEIHMVSLSSLNDDGFEPLTFEQIADVIDWMWVV